MSFREEFGPEYAIPADLLNVLLATGWEDTSWHNDVCPSFRHEGRSQTLWCDAPLREDREWSAGFRFRLETADSDSGAIDAYEWQCEDAGECIRRLTKSEG